MCKSSQTEYMTTIDISRLFLHEQEIIITIIKQGTKKKLLYMLFTFH